MMRTLFPGTDPRLVRRLRRDRQWKKLANYVLVGWEMSRGATRLRGKPYWLTVDPASFCQLRCPFCPTGAGRNVRPQAMLRLDHFQRLMGSLGATLIHMDFMNWGEPLLNPDLYAMIAEAKRHHVDTMLSTNLHAFDEAAAEKLVRSGLDRVIISIDGLTQETYSKYRVGGDYAKVTANLKLLAAKRKELASATPRIEWQFLVFKHNEHEIEQVKETALALGADNAGITAAYLPFRPGIRDEWLPRRREYALYDYDSFPDSPPWHWDASQPKAEGEKPPEVAVKVYQADTREERTPCNWPWAGLAVNPDGSVSPCCSVEEKEYDFGVFDGEGEFDALWNNAAYQKAREHIARFVRREAESIPNSKHACERCFSIGRSRFQIPHTLLEDHG
ncbi:MAG: hypothetical protein A2X36_04295 [Elusimicrobia bacterium GWA2_69_24]|nr:MAG: hypothetical protein A2X36_04295 [Elusimicrobia bacterium GWA2_69_24]HBL16277.1 hypothetical protein [Elusimicrobiota bacterium]